METFAAEVLGSEAPELEREVLLKLAQDNGISGWVWSDGGALEFCRVVAGVSRPLVEELRLPASLGDPMDGARDWAVRFDLEWLGLTSVVGPVPSLAQEDLRGGVEFRRR